MRKKITWIAVGRSGGTIIMSQVNAYDVTGAVEEVRSQWAREGAKWAVLQYVARGRFGENELAFVEEDDD